MWLGDCYPESWYDHLPNEIADPFRLITQWTKEDTAKLQKFLESRGIVVRRPVFDSIDDHISETGYLAKPPVTPRDHYLTLGNTLYSLHNNLKKDQWGHWLNYYKDQGYDVQSPRDSAINCLFPPSLVRMGRDLYIDFDTHQTMWGFLAEWTLEMGKHYRVNLCNTNGHSDAVFCPIGPGKIVATHYKYDYNLTFPGWTKFDIPERLNNFQGRKTWITGVESIDTNAAFEERIIQTASDWVGNWQETVFEVNMLVLDEHNVVAMKEYPPLFKWLEQQGVTVHLFDLRTRSFWDGGWHCFTLDIHREDTKQDLFPQRGDNGVYWREF